MPFRTKAAESVRADNPPRPTTPNETAFCSEWFRLVERYRAAILAYSDAATALSQGPGPEFDQAWQRTEDARRSCEVSRAELWLHEQDHGCSRGAPKPVEPLEYLRRRIRALS